MNILYHMTAPPPAIPGADAVYQDVALLSQRFGGHIVPLYPLSRPSRWFPKFLYGCHIRRQLEEWDREADLHQVHFAYFHLFPVLRKLNRPLVYVVTAGLQGQRDPPSNDLARVRCFVISNERDRGALQRWGVENYQLIRPGIETSLFTHTPPAARWPFVLLVASAPWTRSQFAAKGIDHILQTLSRLPDVRVIFLWRGRFEQELRRRISQFGVERQTEIINRHADINQLLARSHAAVVLAGSSRIVKAYPHSLLESLAAGKPVLISEAIPMADYVSEKECGVVVPSHTALAFQHALGQLVEDYDRFLSNARHLGARDFSREEFLRRFGELYERIKTACK